jgi:hypothetical protein
MCGGIWVVLTGVALYAELDSAIFSVAIGAPALIAVVLLRIISVLLLKEYQRQLSFYEMVLQGQITKVGHRNSGTSMTIAYIEIKGKNQLNEVRVGRRAVPIDAWKQYEVGQMVDFTQLGDQ